MRKSFYLLGIALIWLVACTGAPSNLSHQQTITATKPFTPGTSTALALPESTLSPTRPPTATVTPQPSATSQFPPESRIQFNCLDISSTGTGWGKSSSVVVLDNWMGDDDYLLDMSTGEIAPINKVGERTLAFAVSPDRAWFAYDRVRFDKDDPHHITQDELIISDTSGQVKIAIPWEKGWVGIPGWLDNQWLVINISGLDPLESALRKPAHLLAINPFTGERKILAPDFPDIHTFDMFDWENWSRTMYDPTLTRVVYLTEYDNFSYVLWDLENDREITRLPARIPMWNYIPIPRWSPDGSRFVVEAWIPEEKRLELFQVSRDGESERLTNLYPYGQATLAQYSWSPDGRHLAALLDTGLGLNPELELVVLDTETKEITNYCLKITYFHQAPKIEDSWSDNPPLPIWSPDGTQLLVRNRTGMFNWQVILVDLTRGSAAVIAENMEPMGWLRTPEH